MQTKNKKLSNNLRDLNERLNGYLKQSHGTAKAAKNDAPTQPTNSLSSINDIPGSQADGQALLQKKLDNAYKLLSIYQKQNKSLQSKVVFDSPASNKISELESALEYKEEIIQTLKQEISTVNKVNQTQNAVI